MRTCRHRGRCQGAGRQALGQRRRGWRCSRAAPQSAAYQAAAARQHNDVSLSTIIASMGMHGAAGTRLSDLQYNASACTHTQHIHTGITRRNRNRLPALRNLHGVQSPLQCAHVVSIGDAFMRKLPARRGSSSHDVHSDAYSCQETTTSVHCVTQNAASQTYTGERSAHAGGQTQASAAAGLRPAAA